MAEQIITLFWLIMFFVFGRSYFPEIILILIAAILLLSLRVDRISR
jgi:hypothetical protein